MVCLYGTLPPFQHRKAFTLLVLQAARMKQRPHTSRAGFHPRFRSCLVLSRHASSACHTLQEEETYASPRPKKCRAVSSCGP